MSFCALRWGNTSSSCWFLSTDSRIEVGELRQVTGHRIKMSGWELIAPPPSNLELRGGGSPLKISIIVSIFPFAVGRLADLGTHPPSIGDHWPRPGAGGEGGSPGGEGGSPGGFVAFRALEVSQKFETGRLAPHF